MCAHVCVGVLSMGASNTEPVKKMVNLYCVNVWTCTTQKFCGSSEVLGPCGRYVNTGIITGDQYGPFEQCY